MASRRSARLSAAADNAAPAAPNGTMAPPPKPAQSRKRKAAEHTAPPAPPSPAAPSTPNKRRSAKAAAPPPPATPTPSAVGLMAEGAGSMFPSPSSSQSQSQSQPLRPSRPDANTKAPQTPKKGRSRVVARLADPHATNAPLLSPETSRVVASRPVAAVNGDEDGAARPSRRDKMTLTTTTTDNILEEACRHLVKVDARMAPLVAAHHCRVFSPEGLAEKIDPFESLASGIISQQVSGAAARAIKSRFVALFHPPAAQEEEEEEKGKKTDGTETKKLRFPQPSQVAVASLERLRGAGLSQRKAEYLVGLAGKFASGELSAQLLAEAPYDEVVERLTAVRGLGRWSVEMFACFGLKRLDVFSLGDLGVQRGMAAFVGRDVAKLKSKGGKWKYMSEQDMQELSDRFAPYRSVFMWYMWRVEETDVSTMEV